MTSEQAYAEIKGERWSTLREILRSPKRYLATRDGKRKDTGAWRLGRATHTLLFETEQFGARHPVKPTFAGTGSRKLSKDWDEEHRGEDWITEKDHDWARAMHQAVLDHPRASKLVSQGSSEAVVTWTDEKTGIPCKVRVDHINGRLVEFKTTRHETRELIFWQIEDLLYHAQVAWAADALKTVGLSFPEPPTFIFATKEDPVDVVLVPMSEAGTDRGRALYREALDRLRSCLDSGEWPGIDGGEALEYAPKDASVSLTVGGEEVVL